MHWSTRIACLGIALAGAGGLSCAGPDESPNWSLTKAGYDPYGNAAFLTPANDSRVNLLLLLAAGQGKPGPADLGARTFFAWNDLADAIAPTGDDDSFDDAGLCHSLEGGERDFLAALAKSKATASERQALGEARKAIAATCGKNDAPAPSVEGVATPAGRAFARYLQGAAAFYREDFAAAAPAFADLAKAPDPWLREAASYMMARTAINAATAAALDEYGWIRDSDKRDPQLGRTAETAFQAYLAAYPHGRYAASARGLVRRAHWIAGDDAKLAADYASILASPPPAGEPAALRLSEEIDYKLPDARATSNAAGPLLLAVADLQRMRVAAGWDDEPCCKPISAEELAAQAPAFAGNEAVYGFVRAAHAFHVAKRPGDVLKLIPDDARRTSHDALSFSRQVLRGLALDAVGDRNARGFWLELIGGATAPGQRRAIELALARHDEATGNPGRVFAPESKVSDPIAREILLQYSASPALLRQQARNAADPHERAMAAWVLLAKEVTRGFYADYLKDLPLASEGSAESGLPQAANAFSKPEDLLETAVPLGTFRNPEPGAYKCPALRQTVATLESSPLHPTARLCLGEFMRLSGFDWFPFDEQPSEGLGSSPSQFPGTPLKRQAIYTAIIADRSAPAADRAYAFYRAVQCYAPSGNNSCGGDEVPQSQRKTWFLQLKRDYPQSPWARELKYYW